MLRKGTRQKNPFSAFSPSGSRRKGGGQKKVGEKGGAPAGAVVSGTKDKPAQRGRKSKKKKKATKAVNGGDPRKEVKFGHSMAKSQGRWRQKNIRRKKRERRSGFDANGFIKPPGSGKNGKKGEKKAGR